MAPAAGGRRRADADDALDDDAEHEAGEEAEEDGHGRGRRGGGRTSPEMRVRSLSSRARVPDGRARRPAASTRELDRPDADEVAGVTGWRWRWG